MIRLYESTETEFDHNGIGFLQPVSCFVTEERNGEYELEMEYPLEGDYFNKIKNRCTIMAKPNVTDREQPFRIYKINKPMSGTVKVYARHISYDLSGVILSPYSAGNVTEALSKINQQSATNNSFTFWTDKSTVAQFRVDIPSSVRSIMGNKQSSLLDTYGGEYSYDRYTLKLHHERGNDNGVTIRYGKNLTDLQQEDNIESVYTGVYPFWKKGEDYFEIPEKIINAEGTYNFVKIRTLDLSSEFDEKPTVAELKSKAESYMKTNKIGIPKVSIKVSFIPLEQTEEYKDLAVLERVNLCDTVTVIFPKLGVNATAECIKTVYNVLTERYDSIELGEAKTNIADRIIDQQKQIEDTHKEISGFAEIMAQEIKHATDWLTNGKGTMVARRDAFGNVIDLLFIDTQDINTAIEVMRVGQSGIGFSHNGVNGPYESAWTLDGHFNASFITAGIINAALIKAGILKSVNGESYINMETGVASLRGSLTTVSADGKFNAALFNQGISLYRNNERVGWFQGFNHPVDGEVSWLKSDRIDCTSIDTKGIYMVTPNGTTFNLAGSDNDGINITNIKSLWGTDNGFSIQIVNNIYMRDTTGKNYLAFDTTTDGTRIHNLRSLWVGGIGGNLSWKTVNLAGGGTAQALCRV